MLGHLAELLTTEEIAEAMFVSVNTVRSHVRSLLRKLGVTRRNEAVRRAWDLGLLPRRVVGPGGAGPARRRPAVTAQSSLPGDAGARAAPREGAAKGGGIPDRSEWRWRRRGTGGPQPADAGMSDPAGVPPITAG